MARPSDGGKGSDRRRENGDNYRQNHDRIDWSKKPVDPPKPAPTPTQRWPFELGGPDE